MFPAKDAPTPSAPSAPCALSAPSAPVDATEAAEVAGDAEADSPQAENEAVFIAKKFVRVAGSVLGGSQPSGSLAFWPFSV